jgi:hypothetical protein
MTREIIDVPFPRASVKPLINYLMITNVRARGKYTGTKRKRESVFERHDKTRPGLKSARSKGRAFLGAKRRKRHRIFSSSSGLSLSSHPPAQTKTLSRTSKNT